MGAFAAMGRPYVERFDVGDKVYLKFALTFDSAGNAFTYDYDERRRHYKSLHLAESYTDVLFLLWAPGTVTRIYTDFIELLVEDSAGAKQVVRCTQFLPDYFTHDAPRSTLGKRTAWARILGDD